MERRYWYHAIAYYGAKSHHWWNRQRDDIVNDVLVPYLGQQVKPTTRSGASSLFNFAATSYVTILKTDRKLLRSSLGGVPDKLKDKNFIEDNNATDEFVDEIRVLSSSVAAKSVIQRAMASPLNQIFVVMKFGDEVLDSAFTEVIEPLGAEFGLDVIRVDKIQDGGNISQQILENIAQSRFVLAELSGARPNCYYEAGFAHALGKEIIFVIRDGEDVHFDLSGYRFIQWKTEGQLRNALQERLESLCAKDSD